MHILHLFLSFSLSLYIYKQKYTYIYIYIERERERVREKERERERENNPSTKYAVYAIRFIYASGYPGGILEGTIFNRLTTLRTSDLAKIRRPLWIGVLEYPSGSDDDMTIYAICPYAHMVRIV